MKPIPRPIDFHGRKAVETLMGADGVVFVLPKPELISPRLRILESHRIEQFLIVSAMAPFNNAILPRSPGSTFAMDESQSGYQLLEGSLSFWMGAKSHRELECVVCPDEEKGGSRSNARSSTPATVEDLRSRWISEYLRRVRR